MIGTSSGMDRCPGGLFPEISEREFPVALLEADAKFQNPNLSDSEESQTYSYSSNYVGALCIMGFVMKRMILVLYNGSFFIILITNCECHQKSSIVVAGDLRHAT